MATRKDIGWPLWLLAFMILLGVALSIYKGLA